MDLVFIPIKQIESLEQSIYDMLMSNPEMGFGDMGDCQQTAKLTVEEWVDNNNISTNEERDGRKTFPNGFPSWQEVHFEIVMAITEAFNLGKDQMPTRIRRIIEKHGRGGLYELAEKLTMDFEINNTQWTYEKIRSFVEQEIYFHRDNVRLFVERFISSIWTQFSDPTSNFDDVVEYCMDFVNPEDWHEGDIYWAFRKKIDEQKNQ
ncbi:hypothetical protein NF867_09365 [Solitalea sp. MAHUQ-68]|uniref:Uncharacterized protein n=1 Tax=Solitalea agri TaxID=2953739 RepID=A0A9X2F639_9SPHI|nr:hypothetical protein [Solitalea agri]MCO4293071.1 hypothetical protein [Solitalea agri]